MQWLNPMNDPLVAYIRSCVGSRIYRLRNETDRTRGASAIEWAIITGILALIAITVGWSGVLWLARRWLPRML